MTRLPRPPPSIAARLGRTGRIVYAGAGSSGTIAALDGIELLGTYGWPEERVAFVLASGDRLAPLTGGEEDDEAAARAAIARLRLTPSDAVIAVAASGTTPYTLAAIDAARKAGALTIGIASNAGTPLLKAGRHPGPPRFGPGGDRRLDPDGRGHGPEGGAQPDLDADHDPPRPCL